MEHQITYTYDANGHLFRWVSDSTGRVLEAAPALDCPGCGAPIGYPPAGHCENHETPRARAV